MGYSYSNIQLKAGSRPVDAAKIAEMLAAGHKLKKADSPEEADVVIAVGPENAGGWVTIVSDTFDQDLEACCKAAKSLHHPVNKKGNGLYTDVYTPFSFLIRPRSQCFFYSAFLTVLCL